MFENNTYTVGKNYQQYLLNLVAFAEVEIYLRKNLHIWEEKSYLETKKKVTQCLKHRYMHINSHFL